MSEQCIAVEKLGDIEALSQDSPEQRHLAACPRCRVRLASYHRFLNQDDDAKGPEIAGAEKRMRARLDREIFGEVAVVKDDPSKQKLLHRSRRSGHLIAFAAAASIIIISGAVWVQLRDSGMEGEIILRNGEEQSLGLDLGLPAVLEDGGIALFWSAHPGADSYRVLLFDENLSEIARFDAGTDPLLSLTSDQVERIRNGRRALLWRVEALSGGDLIASSRPDPFQ